MEIFEHKIKIPVNALRPAGSIVFVGNGGFTIIETNVAPWKCFVIDHKTGERQSFERWVGLFNCKLQSLSRLTKRLTKTKCSVPDSLIPDWMKIEIVQDFEYSAHTVVVEYIDNIFFCLMFDGKFFRKEIESICFKIREIVDACKPFLFAGKTNNIELFYPTVDKIIEDFKSLGVEFKE